MHSACATATVNAFAADRGSFTAGFTVPHFEMARLQCIVQINGTNRETLPQPLLVARFRKFEYSNLRDVYSVFESFKG